ncbi:hypothetical protein PMLGA01_070033500, partial [Plasmodium malariae]
QKIYTLNDDKNEFEYKNEMEIGNDTEYEIENKSVTQIEAETQTETDTDLEVINENVREEGIANEKKRKSSNSFKEKLKIVLLDNDYNVYLIEFFFKTVLRIIPFFKINKRGKHLKINSSTIIYNLKIILSFLRSFKNVILSMKNNFYIFIYYFFIKGYISLLLLNAHRALKYFKKVFVLIIFFFGNPVNSINSHPFLIYVTYILYVLTILSKLNMANFFGHIIKKEKKEFLNDTPKKACSGGGYNDPRYNDNCKNSDDSSNDDNNNNNGNSNNNNNNNNNNKSNNNNSNNTNSDDEETYNGDERKNDKLCSNKKTCSNNTWMKQKYEIWMHLEIIRTIKRNYVRFNNNIYLVPLNYLFINMKKLFKKYANEKELQKLANMDDNGVVDNYLKKKNKINTIKKEKYDDTSSLREFNINDKLEDRNLFININNNFVSLYPTAKNVKVPKIYLKGDIDKSFLSTTDLDKKNNLH